MEILLDEIGAVIETMLVQAKGWKPQNLSFILNFQNKIHFTKFIDPNIKFNRLFNFTFT